MRKKYGEDYCGAWECCPVGLIEHIKNARYLKQTCGQSYTGFVWHEFKSLIGLNTCLCIECEFEECKVHDTPPLTLSQRCVSRLKRLFGGIS